MLTLPPVVTLNVFPWEKNRFWLLKKCHIFKIVRDNKKVFLQGFLKASSRVRCVFFERFDGFWISHKVFSSLLCWKISNVAFSFVLEPRLLFLKHCVGNYIHFFPNLQRIGTWLLYTLSSFLQAIITPFREIADQIPSVLSDICLFFFFKVRYIVNISLKYLFICFFFAVFGSFLPDLDRFCWFGSFLPALVRFCFLLCC